MIRTTKRRRNTKKLKNDKRGKKTHRRMKGGLFGVKLPNINPLKVTLSNRDVKNNIKRFLTLSVNLDKSAIMWRVLGYSREHIIQILTALDNTSDDTALVPRVYNQSDKDDNYSEHCTIEVELINETSGEKTKIVDLERDIITRADTVDYKLPIMINQRNVLPTTNPVLPTTNPVLPTTNPVDLVDIKADLNKVDGGYKLTDEDEAYIKDNIKNFKIFSVTKSDKCRKITRRDSF